MEGLPSPSAYIQPVEAAIHLSEKERDAIDRLHQSLGRVSHYRLLGVSEDADLEQIRTSFYEMSRCFHPDHYFRRDVGDYGPRIEAVYIAVTQAYQTLRSEAKRSAYDRSREEGDGGRAEEETREPVGVEPASAPAADPGPPPPEPPEFLLALEDDAEEGEEEVAALEGTERPVFPSEVLGGRFSEEEEDGASSSAFMALDLEPESLGLTTASSAARPVVLKRRSSIAPPPKPPPTTEQRPRASGRRSRGGRRRRSSQYRQKVLSAVRQRRQEEARRAQHYYEMGCQDQAESHILKAESALAMAVQCAPDNATYRERFAQVQAEARQLRATQYIANAENAEGYQNIQEALYNYRKAVEYEVADGRVYFRLSRLVRRFERDDREALRLMQRAVRLSPEEPEYRIALGELYGMQGLSLNARREYLAAVKLAKDRQTRTRAKEGLRSL